MNMSSMICLSLSPDLHLFHFLFCATVPSVYPLRWNIVFNGCWFSNLSIICVVWSQQVLKFKWFQTSGFVGSVFAVLLRILVVQTCSAVLDLSIDVFENLVLWRSLRLFKLLQIHLFYNRRNIFVTFFGDNLWNWNVEKICFEAINISLTLKP